ncbi:MAG: TM2 domain-containing protein [Bacteroidetes Order II. Incertae sedis bacterium]|nr:TM2 domain-containing protein [Bacteroidetes Order II. bacterium]
MEVKKDPTLAALLSFIFPGAGHIYVGRVGFGLMWFFLTVLGGVLILPGLMMWIAGIFMARTDAKRLNNRIAKREQAALETQIAQALPPRNTRKMSPDAFADRFRKLYHLWTNEMISEAEYHAEKQKVINDLNDAIIDDPHDLLASFIQLKQENMVSQSDIAAIKQALTASR